MKRFILTMFLCGLCSVSFSSGVVYPLPSEYLPVQPQPGLLVVPPQPVPQFIAPLARPAVKTIQYFLVPHVIEVNHPVVKQGLFGRLYIVNEKTLETIHVWQPAEVWR